MNRFDEKDFERALTTTLITGTYILNKRYVLDYIFKKLSFNDLKITNGSFTCSLFQDCKFINVIFESVHLDNCEFKGCHFEHVIFKNCTTKDIQFINCKNIPKII